MFFYSLAGVFLVECVISIYLARQSDDPWFSFFLIFASVSGGIGWELIQLGARETEIGRRAKKASVETVVIEE